MSGWHSLQFVSTFHALLQIAGLMVAAVVIATGITVYHFWNRWSELVAIADRTRSRYLPHWRGDTEMTLHNALIEIAILGTAAMLATGYAAFAYGQRKTELVAAAHAAGIAKVRYETDVLRRALETSEGRRLDAAATLRDELDRVEKRHDAETGILRDALERARARSADSTRRAADEEAQARLVAEIEALRRANGQAASRHAAELAELRQRLNQGEVRRVTLVESMRWEIKRAEASAAAQISRLEEKLAQAQRKLASLQSHRRLSIEEKHALIDALTPYAGQQVTIAAIAGDEDGKAYAQDFVEVFEAAGWEHPAVAYRNWDRDPVGVEITLNEHDGRAGRINTGVGALINIARKLSLTDGNTIYMAAEVPAGQVQLKIGRKRPR
jgi:hypothetical protein